MAFAPPEGGRLSINGAAQICVAAGGTPGAAALVSKQALIGELPTPSFLADLK
jgi:hypothetical protein